MRLFAYPATDRPAGPHKPPMGDASLTFGNHQKRCLYCGVSLKRSDSSEKYPVGQLESLMEEAKKTIQDPVLLENRLAELRKERTAKRSEAQYEFRRLLGNALEFTYTPEDLQEALNRIKADLNLPAEKIAVDHIRPRKWGGETVHDNIFLNVCQTCNGNERGFTPFPYWVHGFDGKIETDPTSGQDTFVPSTKPKLTETELRILQTNLAAGLGHIMMSDARVPVLDQRRTKRAKGWTRRSFFVAAMRNMLHLPQDEARRKPGQRATTNGVVPFENRPEELGKRMEMVFTPLAKRNPSVFLSDDAEEYLLSNQRGYENLVQTYLQHILIPMRRAYRKAHPIPDKH